MYPSCEVIRTRQYIERDPCVESWKSGRKLKFSMPYPSPKTIVKPAMMSDEPACGKGSRTVYKEAEGNDFFFTLHL
jgi:hypothetical protein